MKGDDPCLRVGLGQGLPVRFGEGLPVRFGQGLPVRLGQGLPAGLGQGRTRRSFKGRDAMVLRLFALVAVVTLSCSGCFKSGDGDRVDRLSAEQEEHTRQISRMSRKIDTVDEKLSGIQKSVNALLGAGSGAQSAKREELIVASDFASTEEYKGVIQLLGSLQEQVATVQGDFAGFQDHLRAARELEALRDRGAAFQALSQPGEMSRRLDILVKNFSGSIPDAATRSQFLQDVEALKASFFASLSPEEKLQRARAMLTERINNAPSDERMRGMLERQLRSLDDTENAQELGERVDRFLQFEKTRDVGELTQKYNIPEDVVRDSGLVSFGRGGPGFFPGRGGGMPGGGPRGGR